jgi:hypothetical protein
LLSGARMTSGQRDRNGRFKTGNIGGPGRPSGSRNAFGSVIVAAIQDDWERHGPAVLERVRSTSPAAYLRVVASLIPREVLIETPSGDLSHLTDDELAQAIREGMAAFADMPEFAASTGRPRNKRR